MNAHEPPVDRWEARLRATARTLPFPPTPDVAQAVARRLALEAAQPSARARAVAHPPRWAWAVGALVIALAALLAVPEVRAGLIEFLQIGAVRVFLGAPSPTPPSSEGEVIVTALPLTGTAPAVTPAPTEAFLTSVLQLAGETTLEEAKARAGFPVLLPTYPADLGAPDRVYLQNIGGAAVVLVWLNRAEPERARLSLHELGPGTFANKGAPTSLETTTVNGRPAAWTEGPYLLEFLRNGRSDAELGRLVTGHVLIWEDSPMTYRLETDLPLEEAVRIAESLK
jgi:hypothetical protein